MRGALVLVMATAVDVVEFEPYSQTFAGIHCKLGFEMVFAVGAVATLVVGDVGERRQSVGKQEFVHRRDEEVVGLGKHKLLWCSIVDEYPVVSWCPKIARRTVFASHSCGEYRVHEHVSQGVGLGSDTFAQTFVHRPHLQSSRYFTMFGLEGVFAVSPGIAALDKLAVVSQLVVVLGQQRKRKQRQQYER